MYGEKGKGRDRGKEGLPGALIPLPTFASILLPSITEGKTSALQEIQQLLTFVIVGGGPTGVEVAAELYDMINEDLKKVYPKLMKHVSLKLVELQDHVLSTYDRAISEYTKTEFERYLVLPLQALTDCHSRESLSPVVAVASRISVYIRRRTHSLPSLKR